LNELAVIHEEIDVRPEVLDIPAEDRGIRRLEHQRLQAQRFDEPCGNLRAPGAHILRDSLRFDHDLMHAVVEEAAREMDHPGNIMRALGGQLVR
jgi:hypothetical protein